MDPTLSLFASPVLSIALLIASFLLGALLLKGVVRWTEGFSITFGAALKLTAVAVVVTTVLQIAVFAAIMLIGLAGMRAYWVAMGVTLVLSLVIYTLIYARGVKRPDGQELGIGHAVKVTAIQAVISVAVVVVFGVLLAILVVAGVVDLPANLLSG